jgi:hypothetical protein
VFIITRVPLPESRHTFSNFWGFGGRSAPITQLAVELSVRTDTEVVLIPCDRRLVELSRDSDLAAHLAHRVVGWRAVPAVLVRFAVEGNLGLSVKI